jgi:hypothetical protein
MHLNLNLLDAIEEAISSQGFIDSKFNPMTETKESNIFRAFPNTMGATPCIVYEIIGTRPLDEDNSVIDCFKSKVIFYGISNNSLIAEQIADNLSIFFTRRPLNSGSDWFRNISSNKISNKYTRFVNRVSARPSYEDKSDTFVEMVEVDFIWCNCNCDGEFSQEKIEECNINVIESENNSCF